MSDTLVLDVSTQPISLVTWQTAIVWVIERAVEVLEEYPDRPVRSPNWKVQMPSVVRFLKPIKRKRAVKFSRHNVFARDGGRCQYCGSRVGREWGYDHVVPRSQGGRTVWENVVVCCTPCNQHKGGRTPGQAGMRLLSLPVKPKKLPEMPRMMTFQRGMPEMWRPWLRDAVYWNGALEHDD